MESPESPSKAKSLFWGHSHDRSCSLGLAGSRLFCNWQVKSGPERSKRTDGGAWLLMTQKSALDGSISMSPQKGTEGPKISQDKTLGTNWDI